tara:strand:- start:2313 stop:3005 length:693 start_codon:yes stop_codon:yes gene_type:complete
MTATEMIQALRHRCDEASSDSLFSQTEKLDALNEGMNLCWMFIDSNLLVDNVAFDDYTTTNAMTGNWYLDDVLRVERQDTEVKQFVPCSILNTNDYSLYIDNAYSKPTKEYPMAVHWTSETSISDSETPVTFGGLRVFPIGYHKVRVFYRMRPKSITAADVTGNTEIIIGNRNSTVGFDTVEPLHNIVLDFAESRLWKNDNNQSRSELARSRAMDQVQMLNSKVRVMPKI